MLFLALLSSVAATALHVPLLGLPPQSNIFQSPHPVSAFVYPSYASARNTHNSYYVTRTDRNIIAGVRPKGGDVVWRHSFDSLNQQIVDHQVVESVIYTISTSTVPDAQGQGTSLITKMDAAHGNVFWQRQINGYVAGLSASNEGVSVYKSGTLSDGCGVDTFDSEGRRIWSWRCGVQDSPEVIVGTTTKDGYTLLTSTNLVRLSKKGQELTRHKLPHTITGITPSLLLPLSTGPIYVYIPDTYNVYTINLELTEKDQQKKDANVLLSQWKHKLMGTRRVKSLGDAGQDGYFMVWEEERGWMVGRSNSDGDLSKIWEFGKDDAIYAGFKQLEKGTPHIIRISYSPVLSLANFQYLTPNIKTSPSVSGSTFPYKESKYGKMISATVELKPSPAGPLAKRIMLYSETGVMGLWQEGMELWIREEGVTRWRPGNVVLIDNEEDVLEKLEHDAAEIPLPFASLGSNVTLAERTGKKMAIGASIDGHITAIDLGESSSSRGSALWRRWFGEDERIDKLEVVASDKVSVYGKRNVYTIETRTGEMIGVMPRTFEELNDPTIVSVTKTILASPVRTLGDGTQLIKYLNPALKAHVISNTLTLIDSSTGSLIDRFEVEATHTLIAENWLVYTYAPADIGGWTTIVSVEYYVNEKDGGIQKFQQAFRWLGGIKSLGISNTHMGITTKNLLLATTNDQIFNIPRKFLDPRRPTGKPSKDDQEEMLVPYDPVIPPEPRWIVSENFPVFGVQALLSGPSRLESTSFVLGFGTDLFVGTITPSQPFDILSDSFNKVQLMGTIAGLALAVGITRPMVRKKQLKAKWYS